jgi:hypothetical protein
MGDSNVAACPKAVEKILEISFPRFLDIDQVQKNFLPSGEFRAELLFWVVSGICFRPGCGLTVPNFGNNVPNIMGKKLQETLNASVRRLLQPLVRILLRNGIAYGTLAGLIRQVYVDVAFKDFAPQGKKQTVSRVSALTGLTRKEVKRLLEEDPHAADDGQARYSRAVRVISGWLHDERFHGDSGKPAVLPLDGEQNSFALLVKEYSGDIPTMAMLAMLEEGGTVSVSRDRVRLLRHAYVPGGDAIEKIKILGSDVCELISTIDHNLVADAENLRFQRKVSYDCIDPAAVGRLKKISFSKAQTLLEQLDRQYSGHVLEEDDAGGGKYISLGIYYYEQDSEE